MGTSASFCGTRSRHWHATNSTNSWLALMPSSLPLHSHQSNRLTSGAQSAVPGLRLPGQLTSAVHLSPAESIHLPNEFNQLSPFPISDPIGADFRAEHPHPRIHPPLAALAVAGPSSSNGQRATFSLASDLNRYLLLSVPHRLVGYLRGIVEFHPDEKEMLNCLARGERISQPILLPKMPFFSPVISQTPGGLIIRFVDLQQHGNEPVSTGASTIIHSRFRHVFFSVSSLPRIL